MACQPRLSPAAHARELETQIRRFPRGYRRRLRKLARGSSRLGELLYTFPAAAFLLAAGGRTPCARAEAIKLIKDGRPLLEVAAVLELPFWMRRLPPEAFTDAFKGEPVSEEFGRRVINHIPAKPFLTAMWLRWVLSGASACDESFALWLAKQNIYQEDAGAGIPLLPLAAFAWFSRADNGAARSLICLPWQGNMRFGLAVEEARRWLERIIFDYCRDGGIGNGGWFKTREAGGYQFVPLLAAGDLQGEGVKMNNCVATYIPKAASGACLIYSIRRGGQRVATVEVAPCRGVPAIVQLLAAGNTKAGEDVWRAAKGWLSKQGEYPFIAKDSIVQVPIRPSRWEAVWRPYWQTRPAFQARLEPSMRTLAGLRQDLNALARLARGQ